MSSSNPSLVSEYTEGKFVMFTFQCLKTSDCILLKPYYCRDDILRIDVDGFFRPISGPFL